jgi:predicted amidohydrolase
MDLIVTNTSIVTGDGETFHSVGQIGIDGDRIVALAAGDGPISAEGVPQLDARGGLSVPGIINSHAHGCVAGPSMPSGSRPLAVDDVRYFRNRHLLGGTTTLLNVCGLALPSEVQASVERHHPLRIFVSTAHTPNCIQAALDIDGRGLGTSHLNTSVEAVIALGAVALGEGGGGQTLGGGAQDYRYLPQSLLAATGIEIEARDARRLKEALLGRRLNSRKSASDEEFVRICDELGLLGRASAERIAQFIAESVLTPVDNALLGMTELAALSCHTGLPAILHNALPSADHILALARSDPTARLIAAHSNHSSFTAEEAVGYARALREAGVTIDVSTLDCISTHWRNDASNLDALIAEGLVDTLSTDFAGGHWDGILEAMQRMVSKKQLSVPEAVALATGNVAAHFDAFGDAGRLEVGRRADIAIVDGRNLGRVRHVLVGGRLVVKDGALMAANDGSSD